MKRAFTLIEVLVVIGIVVILIGLVLPALSTLAEGGRSAECQSNLRQLASASQAYVTLNKERFAPAVLMFAPTAGAGVRTLSWDLDTAPGRAALPGSITRHLDSPSRVQQCPSWTGNDPSGDPFTGYNYNTTFIGAEGRFPQVGPGGTILDGWANVRVGLASAQCRNTQAAVLGDAGWAGGTNKYMRAPMNTVEGDLLMVCAGTQAFRHLGCSHVARLDGSVHGACTSCAGALSTPQALDQVMGHPANGFLSEDDGPYDPR